MAKRWQEEVRFREEQANQRTAVALVQILNGFGVRKEGGRQFEVRDFFRPGQKKQTPEEMLLVMKANSQAMNMMAGKR